MSIQSTTTSIATASPTKDGGIISTTGSNGQGDSTATLKLELGIGLGIGIPVVLLVGFFVGIKVVKQRRAARYPQDLKDTRLCDDQLQFSPSNDGQPAPQYCEYNMPRLYEAPGREPGWGPRGEYEVGCKSPRVFELE